MLFRWVSTGLSIFSLIICLSGLELVISNQVMVGGPTIMTPEDKLGLMKALYKSNSVSRNLNEAVCATQQVVAGTKYVIYYNQGSETCSECKGHVSCHVVIWEQLWRKPSILRNELQCGGQAVGNPCERHRPKRDLSSSVLTMDKKRPAEPEPFDPEVKYWFDWFIKKYGKPYSQAQDSDTYRRRYKIFKDNLRQVEILNKADEGTAVYGVTKFMDYSQEEYRKYLAPGLTKKLVDIRDADMTDLDTENMPDSVDWRKQGAVTAVKNQGSCGSCWAFSTTGNVEGQWFIKHGKLYSLSEQELVDCDSLDHGCSGGLPSNAYKSIEKLGGLETEKDYPYEATGEKCNIIKKDFRVYVNDSVALSKNETQLAAWLAEHGPISIGINANMMQFYFGGISHPWKIFCSPETLDHGVLIVGYGTENDTPYWIIKNSWGADWGEEGYYRIYRGDGSCGVNQMATSAIID